MITYLRAGRKVRASGLTIGEPENGMTKIKPARASWGSIWITEDEIKAGKVKPPLLPRETQAAAPEDLKLKNRESSKPPPLPRWRQLVDRVRIYEIDHQPDGWPKVQMKFMTEIADALEAAQTIFQTKS